MSKKTTRIAGVQLPVSTNIQFNKKEILKAIDWAKENEVKHLLTPEGSLSGYGYKWSDNLDEIQDALKEVDLDSLQWIVIRRGPVLVPGS